MPLTLKGLHPQSRIGLASNGRLAGYLTSSQKPDCYKSGIENSYVLGDSALTRPRIASQTPHFVVTAFLQPQG